MPTGVTADRADQANKQDLPTAMSVAEVTVLHAFEPVLTEHLQVADALNLHKLENRRWYIQGTWQPSTRCAHLLESLFAGMSALGGEGVVEAIDWIEFAL